MRALSLHQPWAQFVALGAKTIETRSWATPYRGLVAIHAAKTEKKLHLAGPLLTDAEREDLMDRAADLDREGWPLGAVVAVASLVNVFTVTAGGVDDTGRGWIQTRNGGAITLPAADFALGNLAKGRCAWMLRDVRPLAEPYPLRGRQGLWKLGIEQHDILARAERSAAGARS